jgi:hypothetical protein
MDIVVIIRRISKNRSRILSEITFPSEAGIGILSVFFRMAHRVISPILGTSRFAKYPTITARNALKEFTR